MLKFSFFQDELVKQQIILIAFQLQQQYAFFPQQITSPRLTVNQKQQEDNQHQKYMQLFIQISKQHLDTKYPILKEVAQLMEFQIAQDIYSLLWTDYPLSVKEIKEQPNSARVNHIPEITQITRKNKMAVNLNQMRIHFPKEYNFYPQTWVLPSDLHKLMKKHTKGKIYIAKPENGCQGQGIYLIDNPAKLQKQSNEVVQQYIMNPLLIKSLKFDLRIYVLITCINPLRVFLYDDGIVRFATDKFQKPNEKNLDNNFSHLTNYAINKKSDKFVVDQQDPENSHKRLISDVFKNEQLKELMSKVSKIIMKTIISGLSSMQNGYGQCKKTDPSSCFQLLGFDIILNDKNEPILLQVNQNPSLMTDTNFDQKLKSQLVRNILDIVTGGYNSLIDQKMETKIKLKDRHQMMYKNNFSKIYPCQTLEETQYYDQFMLKANTLYKQKFGINITRNVKKVRDNSLMSETSMLWNQNPMHYTKDKVERVYGVRLSKTSNFKKRLIFI